LAAYQYGRFAVLSILIIAAEGAVIGYEVLTRRLVIGVFVGIVEVLIGTSLWWAVECQRAQSRYRS
jgi:hypothetical protein